MNSQINLTAAKVRKLLVITALVVCPFLALQSGKAQSVATATLLSGGLNNITIDSNGSFTLTLGVTTNFMSSGYTVFYQSNNGQGLFRVGVPRNNLSPIFNDPVDGPRPIFNDPTTSNGIAFGGMGGVLNPSNAFDLGFTGDTFNNQAGGTFSLQSVLVTALNAAPGVYTIFLDSRSVMTDHPNSSTFTDVAMGGPNGPSFTITIIPEPATVGLAVMGGAMLLLVIWRKQRARA